MMRKVSLKKNNTFLRISKKLVSFDHLRPLEKDPILGILAEFNAETNPNKISLSAGTYKDDNGKPVILSSVRAAQKKIFEEKYDHEYLPIEGHASFIRNSLNLAYSNKNQALKEGRIAGIQTLSGTGAVFMGLHFLAENYDGCKRVLIPDPTWPNHMQIALKSGLPFRKYRYYDNKNQKLDIDGFIEDLLLSEPNSIVILHSCAHNPTGMDPSVQEWELILDAIKSKKHFPLFDNAYQGFATGDLVTDAYAIRRFAEANISMGLAQSFAKNFGLYGHRIGCFSLITETKREADICLGYLKRISRSIYSSTAKYGAQIVDVILSDPELTKEWHKDLKIMSGRLTTMRTSLHKHLLETDTKLNWDHIVRQIGMFAYTGLTANQVAMLKKEDAIYLTDDGRISIAGLNTSNVKKVAECFNRVSKII